MLGWGGYWAWDPVENASLLPWLTATAFLHTALGRGARRAGWNRSLACASFVLVLVGTFLTRSGAVASVHAFTDSPLGPMLLGFVLLAVVASTVLTGRQAPDPAGGTAPPLLSRTTAVLVNAVLLVAIAAVVLIGTIFPLLSGPLGGVRASVGPDYYQRTAVPLAVVVLLAMGVTPALRVRDRARALRRLVVPGGVALATVAVVGLLSRPGLPALAAFGAAAFVLTGLAGELPDRLRPPGRRRLAGLVAHTGIALVAVGVAGSSAYGRDAERTAPDRREPAGGRRARPAGRRGPRPADRDGMAVRARLRLSGSGDAARTVTPALRYHPARDTAVTVPAIDTGPLRDTYVTLLAVSPDGGSATLRLAVNPLVGLIWAGGALTAAGGLPRRSARARPRRRPGTPATGGPGSSVPAGARRDEPTSQAWRPRVWPAPVLALTVAVGVLVALGLRSGPPSRDSAAGAPGPPVPAPALSGPTLDGGRFDLADAHGHVVLVNVFASWCGPCRDELPLLVDAGRRWSPQGLRVVGLNVRDGRRRRPRAAGRGRRDRAHRAAGPGRHPGGRVGRPRRARDLRGGPGRPASSTGNGAWSPGSGWSSGWRRCWPDEVAPARGDARPRGPARRGRRGTGPVGRRHRPGRPGPRGHRRACAARPARASRWRTPGHRSPRRCGRSWRTSWPRGAAATRSAAGSSNATARTCWPTRRPAAWSCCSGPYPR